MATKRGPSRKVGNNMTGAHFKGGTLHEAFKSAGILRRRVNDYFDACDLNGKDYTVPGRALALGVRTRALTDYNYPLEKPDYQKVVDYALQRVEAYTVEKLFVVKGSTKGVEFLLQNTANYANRSDVKTETNLEVTEKQRIQSLPDSEVKRRLADIGKKIVDFADAKNVAGDARSRR